MNKRTCLILICSLLCLVLLLGACGKRSGSASDSLPKISIQDWEGVYAEELAQRGVLTLSPLDDRSFSVIVDWPSSAYELSHWEMTGVYDGEKDSFVYKDGVRIDKTFDEAGRENDKIVYTRGSGSFSLTGSSIVWTDSEPSGNGAVTFIFSMSQDEYQRQQTVVSTPAPAPVTVETAPKEGDKDEGKAEEEPDTPARDPAKYPIITKSPTDETVKVGGSCAFVARYENAIWAVWHFVSPDGKTDIPYDEINEKFPTLDVWHGMYSTMKLNNIPLELNGWSVYCRYTNNNGSTDTKSALITVLSGADTTTAAAPEPSPAPSTVTVANEWKETLDLDTAVKGSGVSFTALPDPSIPEGLKLKTYRYLDPIIEASYADADGTSRLIIRKSDEKSGQALSGDYNIYSKSWNLPYKGVVLHCTGNGETVNTLTFDKDGHYSISCRIGADGKGLTAEQLKSILSGIL